MNKYLATALFAALVLTLWGAAWGANPADFGQVLGSNRLAGGLPTIRVPIVIGTGNTFQTILPASAGRRSFTVQNNNATDSCWLDYGQAATPFVNGVPAGAVITAGTATKAGGILLLPGGSYGRYYPYNPSDEIEGTCTSTADTMRVEYQ